LKFDNSNIEITGKNGNNDRILIEYYGRVEINNTKINININNTNSLFMLMNPVLILLLKIQQLIILANFFI